MDFEIQTVPGLGREFHFLLDSPDDHIQNVIRSGTFYELEELELIAELVDCPRRILDVGANIGNHSLYFAHRFQPELTIPVEPNPRVIPLLRANMGLNWHPSFDLSLVGYGLSDRDGLGTSEIKSEANLGGARLVTQEGGHIPIVKADDVLDGMGFDLIKIDVEGMENQVIEGMANTLIRSDALVFVEVLLSNIDATMAQMARLGYEYRQSYQRYGRCLNLIFEVA
jgi:FkbM family methyltransferase